MDHRGLSGPELQAVTALWARTGRTIEARFTGSSMEPAIPDGSLVRLRCGGSPRLGDVVAFLQDGRVLLHRLVATDPGLRLTRGDAVAVPDAPLGDDPPFACVVALQRGGEWVEPPAHLASRRQALVLGICRTAARVDPRAGRLVIALLRRLRRRGSVPRLDLDA